MKIGILTQPLHTNYGGLLQSYALQSVLKNMGHDVLTIDIPVQRSKIKEIRSIVGRIRRKYFMKEGGIDAVFFVRPSRVEEKVIKKNLSEFIKDNIQITDKIAHVGHMHRLEKYHFDAYVVGSDQVWRPKYSPGISTYFLDFLGGNNNIKRIAYAASFGVDTWEFSPELTNKCRDLLHKFDAVSVREDSAVELCNKYLDIDAAHVLDPTLLINVENYISLINKYCIPEKGKTVMAYILDRSEYKDSVIRDASKALGLKISSAAQVRKYSKSARNFLTECTYPPVAEWLRCFYDAAFIVTDSFHGVVFSIIFNKPFIVIGNYERGMTRFSSLLNLLKLNDRLVLPGNKIDRYLFEKNIDFNNVNRAKSELQKFSLDFLHKSLCVNCSNVKYVDSFGLRDFC